MQFTTSEILRNRKQQIFNRTQEINERIYALQMEMQELERERHMLLAEHEILERVDEKALIIDTNKQRETQRVSRVMLEDAVRMIFDEAGRPVRIGDLIDELEKYGYVWSKYQSAYARIKSLPFIEDTGARGYVQFVRGGDF
jgi:hypothetical protein